MTKAWYLCVLLTQPSPMMPSITAVELIAASRIVRANLPAATFAGYTVVISNNNHIRRLAKPFRINDRARHVADATIERTEGPA